MFSLGDIFTNNQRQDYSEDTIDILRLIRSENVGARTFLNLVGMYGSPRLAIENIGNLSLKGGRAKPIRIYSYEEALKEIELLNKNKSYLLTYNDSRYSRLLLQIYDFPPILAYKGNIDLLTHEKTLAIVGARNSSVNARVFTKKIVRELVEHGFVTVSGLARGIDTVVHQNSLSSTIAVIAGGIDYVYPAENSDLFRQLSENSLILAELPIGSKPFAKHFPQRNRIISGISLGTAVIEATFKSGSLITARFAMEHNRDIFAMPNFPLDPRSQGTNQLIKDGAYLLSTVDDIIDNVMTYKNLNLKLDLQKNKSTKIEIDDNSDILQCEEIGKLNTNFSKSIGKVDEILDSDRRVVKSLLSSQPVTYDKLAMETGLSMPVIFTICLELELAGKIVRNSCNSVSLIYLSG